MKNDKKNLLLKNKNLQRGASVTEVIFAIGLVIAVTPFIYNQVSEMTHVVHDVSVAHQITGTRDNVLEFMRTSQNNFHDGSNEIVDTTLNTIAPGAAKGIVFLVPVDGTSNIKNLESYLLFSVDDTKYRASSIAKYIGSDAAVVGDDNRAYAKDWAVELPSSWSDVLETGESHLVYRITRDFGGDDKTLYLHRSNDLGDGLNTMLRNLHMGDNFLQNVNEFHTKSIIARSINNTPLVKVGQDLIAENVSLYNGANIEGGTVDFHVLDVMKDLRWFETVTAQQLGTTSQRCNLFFQKVTCSTFGLNELSVLGNANLYVKVFTVPGDLLSPNILADIVAGQQNATLYLALASTVPGDYGLVLNKWNYPEKISDYTSELKGPRLREVFVNKKSEDLARTDKYYYRPEAGPFSREALLYLMGPDCTCDINDTNCSYDCQGITPSGVEPNDPNSLEHVDNPPVPMT